MNDSENTTNSGEVPSETVTPQHEEYQLRRTETRSWEMVERAQTSVDRFVLRITRNRVTGTLYKFIHNIFADNVIGIAAQTAFYLLLAIFPIVLVVTSLLARLPLDVDAGILENLFPRQVLDILIQVIDNSPTSTTSTILPIILSVWSASAGIWALMRGVCVSHTGKQPNFVKGRFFSFLLMFGFLMMIAISLALWVFSEQIFEWLSLTFGLGQVFLNFVRYVFTSFLLYLFVLSVYVVTPGFAVKKRYMSWGAIFAAVGWQITSFVFELAMSRFFNYSVLYGSIGVFLGLAIWLLALSVVILLGAELNALIIGLAGSKAVKGNKMMKGEREV